jgi:hypothetical protein
MYDKIKNLFFYITVIAVICLFLWNLYTMTFHGYVTNGFWETYYEEEPHVFILDSIELFIEVFLPFIIIFSFYLIDYITNKLRKDVHVSSAVKAKRLRRKKRKKRKKKRKQ